MNNTSKIICIIKHNTKHYYLSFLFVSFQSRDVLSKSRCDWINNRVQLSEKVKAYKLINASNVRKSINHWTFLLSECLYTNCTQKLSYILSQTKHYAYAAIHCLLYLKAVRELFRCRYKFTKKKIIVSQDYIHNRIYFWWVLNSSFTIMPFFPCSTSYEQKNS